MIAIVIFSCVKNKDITGTGVLKGKITIGPICPVERIPPDPACLPTAETYKAWATVVWTSDKKSKLATIDPKLDGTYLTELPAGEYTIDFEVSRTFGAGGSNLPASVTIANKDTTTLNITIDTGIR